MKIANSIYLAVLFSSLSASAIDFGSAQKMKDQASAAKDMHATKKACGPDTEKFCTGKTGLDQVKCLQGISKDKLKADCANSLPSIPGK